jgi:hypothetical protein
MPYPAIKLTPHRTPAPFAKPRTTQIRNSEYLAAATTTATARVAAVTTIAKQIKQLA